MRYLLTSLLLASSALAQHEPTRPSQATPQAAAAVVSPEILPDHRVTFRLRAPQATSVEVTGDFWPEERRTEKLVKDGQGMWSVTVGPLPPDDYSYLFLLDGVHIPDPSNWQIKPGVPETQSAFTVPGPESALRALTDVPHGEIRTIYYHANSLGKPARMQVYLPPGYEAGKNAYPVLYLFHGGGDDDTAWTTIGHANFLLDNLIAQGKARPMIVVMPSLRALDLPIPAVRAAENEALFRKTMLADVIPYTEAHFRTLSGPANRAVGGLGIGRNFLPDFVWPTLGEFGTVLSVSGGADPAEFATLQAKFPGQIDNRAYVPKVRFFMGDGLNDHSYPSAKNMAEELKKRGYQVTFVQNESGHGWPGFRSVFQEFLPTAFR